MMDETECQEILVDFGKICRLCLTSDGVLISLFEAEPVFDNGNRSIPEKIMDLMSIVVIKNDGFPSWICHNCLSQVDKCYEFFDQCRMNQAALNESYIAALSDAGINISIRKAKEDADYKIQFSESKDKIITVYNNLKTLESKAKDIEKEAYTNQIDSSDYSNEFKTFISKVSTCDSGMFKSSNSGVTQSFICSFCGIRFHNKNAAKAHIQLKHIKLDSERNLEFEKFMLCKYCGMSCNRKNISRHFETVHKITKNLDTNQKDLGSFDCTICYRPFLRQSSLRNHIEKVHGDNLEVMAEVENCEIVWNCSECECVFLEEVNLIQHYGDKHSKYPLQTDGLRALKCKDLICACGVINSNSFDAALHSVFYHCDLKLENETECPGCEKTFKTLMDLKIHLISYHWFSSVGAENECTLCKVMCDSKEQLRLHLSEIHQIILENNLLEDDKFNKKGVGEEQGKSLEEKVDEPECDACRKCYKMEGEPENHEKISVTSHKCSQCGKGFKTSSHLKKHVAEFHNTSPPVKCPLCPKIFPRKMNLHHHYKRRHLKQTKKFVCSYCGVSLKGIVALRSHEDRLHRNIRRYKCSECPEAFTTRGILRKHAQRHLTERPMLQCQFCDRKFTTISGIERHIKTHEGIKEFKCDSPLCGKSFYTKSELKRHIKFHTRDFKHICSICNHKFMSPGELKKHSTKHTGERPFKCHLCSCVYSRRDDKVKHLKRVHNLKVKRVYGRSFIRSNSDSYLVDTIVIDDSASENIASN